jgi:hypothetical protein
VGLWASFLIFQSALLRDFGVCCQLIRLKGNKLSTCLNQYHIEKSDRLYIDQLRGLLILRVMLGHLGLLWFYEPYSSYLGAMFPILFFVSGAASYNSYTKSKFAAKYLKKRVVSLLAPYFVLMGIIVLSVQLFSGYSIGGLYEWFIFLPDTKELPFDLGQTWFLQTLLLAVLMSMPLFYLSIRNAKYLLIPACIGVAVICFNSVVGLNEALNFYGVNIYLAITYLVFFLMGPMYYGAYKISKGVLSAVLILLAMVFVLLVYTVSETNFNPHKSDPNAFFLVSSLLCLLFFLRFKASLQWIFSKVTGLNWLLLFSSKHAYAIFLLHTVVIGYVELALFTEKLTGNYGLALIKMMLVSFITLALAPFYSRLSDYIKQFLLKREGVMTQ